MEPSPLLRRPSRGILLALAASALILSAPRPSKDAKHLYATSFGESSVAAFARQK